MVNRSERAQLLLIGSVVVAVAILGTVVLLNIIHVPPDVSAKSDSQSVENVERVNDAFEDDLRELALMHTSVNETGEPLPYVDDDDNSFTEAVNTYSGNYTTLASTASPSVPSIEYLSAEAEDGAIAYQNETGSLADSTVISSPDRITRLLVTVEEINDGFELFVPRSGGSDNVRITVASTGDVIVDSAAFSSETVCSLASEPVEISITDGQTEIQSDGTVCASFELDLSNPNNVQIDGTGSTDPEGTYTVAAVSGNCNPSNAICIGNGDTIDLNPTFHVVYQDANVAYETTFSVFGGES